jgi:NAD(P)-dependent dehydrogenase (short-subunit alcohol dehydrogenase family)
MGRLDGKAIVMTGAAGFIGSTCARIIRDEGAQLLLVDVSPTVTDVAGELNTLARQEVIACVADITVESDVERCISTAVKRFGQIDGLWNNAAALSFDFLSLDTCIVDLDFDYFKRAITVNTLGAFLLCKYAIPEMTRLDTSSIVNTSSIGSTRGDEAWSAYGVSKAALNRLTLDVATQYGGRGLRCNTVIVGSIPNPERMAEIAFGEHTMSEYQLLTRPGRPEDIGQAVVFLLSDESSFITAESIRVDGGINAFQPWLIDRRRQQRAPE